MPTAAEILDISGFLARREKAFAESRVKLEQNLTDLGPAYAVRWASEAIRLEAEVKAARVGRDLLAAGRSVAEAAAELQAEALRRLDYLVPSNSDLEADIRFAQSLGALAKEFAGADRYAARSAAADSVEPGADPRNVGVALEEAFVAGALWASDSGVTEDACLAAFAAWGNSDGSHFVALAAELGAGA